MAISANTNWTADLTSGTDTNGGGFNPTSANMSTDLTATSATGTAPVVSSASYSFVAGDVGAWVFVQSGTNWIPGWYKISSVATGSATLNATAGAAILYANGVMAGLSTSNGCATTASPTGGKWSVDYSTLTTTLAASAMSSPGSGTLLAWSGSKVSLIGNIINLTAGTNVTLGWYEITTVAAGSTFNTDRNCCTGMVTGGAGNVGAALLTPGKAAGLMVGGNKLWAVGSTNLSSISSNVSNGVLSLPNSTSALQTRVSGYTTTRGDNGRATFTATVANGTMISCGTDNSITNLILDGNSQTTYQGVNGGEAENVKFSNFTNTAHASAISQTNCEVTGCTGSTLSAYGASSTSWATFCNYHDNTTSGAEFGDIDRCQFTNNTGGSSCGVLANFGYVRKINACTFYGMGSHAISLPTAASPGIRIINALAYGNTGSAISAGAAMENVTVRNLAAGSNASTFVNISAANISGTVTITADPFTNKAGNVYTLNSTAGGGAACKGAGWPATMPAGLSAEAIDIGAFQAAAGGGSTVYVPIRTHRSRVVSVRSVVRRAAPFPSGINTITLIFPIISTRTRISTRTLLARRTLPVILQPITSFRYVPVNRTLTRSRPFYVVHRRPSAFPVLRPFPLFVRSRRVVSVRSVLRRPFPFPVPIARPFFVHRTRTVRGRTVIDRRAVAFPILRPFPLFVRSRRVGTVRLVVRRPFPFPSPGVSTVKPFFIHRARVIRPAAVSRAKTTLLAIKGPTFFLPVPPRRVGVMVKYPQRVRTMGVFPAPAIRTTLVTVRKNVR